MKQIRSSKFSKFLAYYLAIMMFIQVTQPLQMYALTSGPTQPEFNAFTPIGTSDMVDLASGDFNYNIPIMDVGGYPINLAYNSGVTMDQEASWVGLGWNLNVGQIERQVRGLPDDFNGDKMIYENDLRDNFTVGSQFKLNGAFSGFDALKLGVGLGVQWNTYEGITWKPSYGVSFELSENCSIGLDFTSATGEGATISPSVSISKKTKDYVNNDCSQDGLKAGGTLGLGFSSRKGVSNLNLSVFTMPYKHNLNNDGTFDSSARDSNIGKRGGGSLSYNNQTYTPSKRVGFENGNFSFNGALGAEFFLVEGQGQITGYGSYQKIASEYKRKEENAYGYENSHYKSGSGVLDFNRENERTINENTTVLASTNYTYDIYNISGQGIGGMFRPYRSQVSYVYNDNVTDYGFGGTVGLEFGGGNLVHFGGDITVNPSHSHTGGWFQGNNVLPYFKESANDLNKINYEPVTFKLVGGLVIDPEESLYTLGVHENKALRIDLGGSPKNRKTEPSYYDASENPYAISEKIKRKERFLRNQVIQKVTAEEGENDPFISLNGFANKHHTAGVKVLQTDGTSYVYGVTAYNTKKVEATFDVSGRDGDNTSGLVEYNGSTSGNHRNASDKYLNKITTPKYAHSYLLSSVLSSDYEDIDGNGPSLNDLGSYTQFIYDQKALTSNTNLYKWRIPFNKNTATYNNGLFSKNSDQKGTYIYGEKELVYLDKIVTKTHVAFFDLEERKDAIGTSDEHGGFGNERLKRIKNIRLYSRPEVTINGEIKDPNLHGINVKPIKTAHFVYDYSLCPKTPNNKGETEFVNGIDVNLKKGKLTLKKVYFTYRNSNMGKYTPYTFEYSESYHKTTSNGTVEIPFEYNIKGFDIWGNFKPNNPNSGEIHSALSTTEFPFVEQNEATANQYTGAWSLKTVNLPSGGKIDIETESDDYQFVQDKKAMQMFNVIGAGNDSTPTTNNTLYTNNDHHEYIYIDLDTPVLNEQEFKNKYLSENLDEYIYFRFLLNMTGNVSQYDYVSGYFQIDHELSIGISNNGLRAALPLKFLKRDGGTGANKKVNPIAKAGWGFGRTYLNREVYSLGGQSTNTSFVSIVNDLLSSIGSISELITGPNKALQDKGCAQRFVTGKSWVRLENANGKKLGGGLRVKSVKLSDNWDTMLNPAGGTNLGNMYGQEYSYTEGSEDGVNAKSSGVATFEPNASSENPLVKPFFPKNGSYGERIAAPRENNYVETPFGENFFPSPKVTYSRVTVKNSYPENPGKVIKKHASGKVVSTFYTTRDFPTKVEWTGIDSKNDIPKGILGALAQLANVRVRSHLTMSQGFSVETNDMNGKIRLQEVFAEGVDDESISKVEYIYNEGDNKSLDNKMTVINSKGEVGKSLIGLDYDMVNDFNESFSRTSVAGFDGNLATFLVTVFPGFTATILPKISVNENQLRTAVTTKHVHKTGILVEKIATDNGSTISTRNLAWDAESGQVLLTETANEYGDNYYSFNYPAYWMYSGMGLASTNIGIEGELVKSPVTNTPDITNGQASNNPYFKINGENDLSKYFHLGDELLVDELNILPNNGTPDPSQLTNLIVNKLWVVGFNSDKSGILLMDRKGNYVNKCDNIDNINFKIVRSGYRNLQVASMASVTSMINPIRDINGDGKLDFDVNAFSYNDTSAFNPRIINASAVVYNDFWKPNGESNLPNYPEYDIASTENYILPDGNVKYPYMVANPYVLNIKGDWRALESYAYLTGRNHGDAQINNPRNEGFYKDFSTFYKLDTITKVWSVDKNKWTYASSVTKYSPYGVELENKDALDRHSAAQYGYNYTLPMAVASNSKYAQMGFEGFEETPTTFNGTKHFGFDFNSLNEDLLNSHTGKKSIKVDNNAKVVLTKSYKKQQEQVLAVSCPVENSGDCVFITQRAEINYPGGPSGNNNCIADNNGGNSAHSFYCFKMQLVLPVSNPINYQIESLDPAYPLSNVNNGYSYNNGFLSYFSNIPVRDIIVTFNYGNGITCSITLVVTNGPNGALYIDKAN